MITEDTPEIYRLIEWAERELECKHNVPIAGLQLISPDDLRKFIGIAKENLRLHLSEYSNAGEYKLLQDENQHLRNQLNTLRADLANKPALDAEVREAIDFTIDEIPVHVSYCHAICGPDGEQWIDEEKCDYDCAKHRDTLISAASAVQEVTVEELIDAIADTPGYTGAAGCKFSPRTIAAHLASKYPNGLKLVKERKDV